MEFDLKKYLIENSKLKLTENKTFGDLLYSLKNIESNKDYILLKVSNPFDTLSSFFSIVLSNKIPVIVATEIRPYKLQQIKENIYFDELQISKNSISNYYLSNNNQFVLFTSGSTGSPKAIVQDFNNLFSHLNFFNNKFNPKQQEEYLINLPLNHVGGLMLLFRAFFNKGKAVSSMSDKISYLSLVPAQIEKYIGLYLNDLKKLKALFIGGAMLSRDLKQKLQEHEVNFYETYGMTETLSFITLNSAPFENVLIKLDSDNKIIINSPTLYIGTIEKNIFYKREFDFFTTSDIGTLNNLNQIVFVKRSDRVINTGGVKVNLFEVENLIKKELVLNKFIATAIPDIKWGEKLILFYDKSENLKLEDILQLKNKIDPPLRPKFFIPFDFKNFGEMKFTTEIAYQAYLEYIFDLHYVDNKSETTNVYFHGFMEDKSDFYFSNNIKCNHLYISLPGHGESRADNFQSLGDIRNKLADLIMFKCNKFNLIGYSMGGRFLLDLIHFKNLDFNKIVLISSGLGLKSNSEKSERLNSDLKLFDNISLEDFFQNWYSLPLFGNYSKHPDYKKNISKKIKHDKEEWKKSQYFFSQGVHETADEYLPTLKKYNHCILYICGERDEKYLKNSEILKKLGINVQIIPDAFHNLHKTHADKILSIISHFLENL